MRASTYRVCGARNPCTRALTRWHGKGTRVAVLRALVPAVCALLAAAARAQDAPPPGPPAMPPARAIPGITAADQFPGGCVDCHIDYVEMQMDERISTLMAGMVESVEPWLLEIARQVARPGTDLAGAHPDVGPLLGDIPAACDTCHGGAVPSGLPLGPLLHRIHLAAPTGPARAGGAGETQQEGPPNGVFLSVFQGECTHCHKLDAVTGSWTMPSGPER